jgi:hypothetical protein
MVVGIVSLLQSVLCVYALVRCARDRWITGLAGGVLRLVLIGIVAFAIVSSPLSMVPGIVHGPTVVTGGLALAVGVASFAGPLVSFVVILLAWRRTRNLPAAEEQDARRPLKAWIPVGMIDAIFVVIQVGALMIGRDT